MARVCVSVTRTRPKPVHSSAPGILVAFSHMFHVDPVYSSAPDILVAFSHMFHVDPPPLCHSLW